MNRFQSLHIAEQSRWLLALLFLLAFVLRAGFVLTLENREYLGDSADYLICAANILSGEGFTVSPNRHVQAHVAPGYPLFLAGIKLLPLGSEWVTIRLIQALLGALTILPAFLLGRELLNSAAGVLTALMVAVYPYYIYWTGMVATETLCIFLVACFLFLGVSALKYNFSFWPLSAGVVLGFASLTRSTCLGLSAVMIFALLIAKRWEWRRSLLACVLFGLGFGLTISPYMVRNYLLFGRFVPITLGSHMLYTQAVQTLDLSADEKRQLVRKMHSQYYSSPKSPEEEFEGHQVLKKEAYAIFKARPSAFVPVWTRNLFRFWSFYPTQFAAKTNRLYMAIGLLSYGIIFVFFIPGIVRTVRNLDIAVLLLGSLLFFTFVHAVFLGMVRYRLPVEIVIIALAAVFMAGLLPEKWKSLA